jgi:hypothetical protein
MKQNLDAEHLEIERSTNCHRVLDKTSRVFSWSLVAVQVIDAVCSLDSNTTYTNDCHAACANDDANLVPGACKKKP